MSSWLWEHSNYASRSYTSKWVYSLLSLSKSLPYHLQSIIFLYFACNTFPHLGWNWKNLIELWTIGRGQGIPVNINLYGYRNKWINLDRQSWIEFCILFLYSYFCNTSKEKLSKLNKAAYKRKSKNEAGTRHNPFNWASWWENYLLLWSLKKISTELGRITFFFIQRWARLSRVSKISSALSEVVRL